MFNLNTIFSTAGFEPHSVHFADAPLAMWLIIIGHILSFLAYTLIPVTILYVVRKRKDLVYNWMFLLFGAFIVLCGLTHGLHILVFWYPLYRFEAIVEIVTFIVSFATFLMFLYLMPQVVKLTSPRQMEEVNKSLADEIDRHKRAEEDLLQKSREFEKANEEMAAKNEELERLNNLIAGRESSLAELMQEVEDFHKTAKQQG